VTEEQHAEELDHETKSKNIAIRFAIAALLFALVASIVNIVFSARVADSARADAVAVSVANEQKLCETFSLLVDIYTDPDVPKTYTVARLTRAFVGLLNSLDCRDAAGRVRPDLPLPPLPDPSVTVSPRPRPSPTS
jgi:hypothetical protein